MRWEQIGASKINRLLRFAKHCIQQGGLTIIESAYNDQSETIGRKIGFDLSQRECQSVVVELYHHFSEMFYSPIREGVYFVAALGDNFAQIRSIRTIHCILIYLEKLLKKDVRLVFLFRQLILSLQIYGNYILE